MGRLSLLRETLRLLGERLGSSSRERSLRDLRSASLGFADPPALRVPGSAQTSRSRAPSRSTTPRLSRSAVVMLQWSDAEWRGSAAFALARAGSREARHMKECTPPGRGLLERRPGAATEPL